MFFFGGEGFFCFPSLLALDVGGLGFKFCVFVTGWRHAFWSEWPFTIIISAAPVLGHMRMRGLPTAVAQPSSKQSTPYVPYLHH